jgi:hypothetical protein
VRSVNGPQFTVIQGRQLPGTITGDGAVRCVYLTNGANLFGFTLTNGATRNSGDFFEIVGGGFLAPLDSAIIVCNCVIAGNSAASQGGGAYTGGRIIRCTFSGNSAILGGGLYGGSLTVFGAVLNDCVISGNFANDAAGVLSAGMTNCLIIGNMATNSGGGAYESLLNNCTVSRNSASIGGGLYKSTSSYTPCLVYNSIVYGNTSSDSMGGSNHLNCTVWNSCTAPLPSSGQGNITNNPVFIDSTSWDFRLQSNSICINSGNNVNVNSLTDLVGNPRIASGLVDMGAYEFQGPAPSSRGTHFVNLNNPTPTPPYDSWATAATNIQDAIDIALPGAEVIVTNGVYAGGGHGAPSSVTNRIETYKAVTIRSAHGPGVTRIEGWQVPGTTNGDGAIRCAWLSSGATLSGFMLTNGATRSGDSGGGAYCDSTVSVSNCFMINNAASAGGGVFGGTIFGCSIIGNSAANEGGGAHSSSLVDCVLSNNSAFNGGGAYWCSVTNSILSANSCPGNGAAAAYGALTQCKVLGNSGGVATYGSTLESCLVAFNIGAGSSGFMNGHQPDPARIRNCTITSNTAWGTRFCLLTNSIIMFNGAGSTNNDDDFYFSSYCCTAPMPLNGFGCITNVPLFVDPANGNFRLQPNSPCINAGDNASVGTSMDLDGNPRIRGGRVDMGAYEFQYGASSIAPQLGIVLSGQTITLSWPLWASNFVLKAASGIPTNSSGWSTFGAPVTTTEQGNRSSFPLDGSTKVFRLLVP